ncbi:hypothetical protein BKA67DRAFT_679391 [Truncatella angustata]|uniref:Cyclin N-terminal domain-containing protein n=1 Tax=Truncatella angustata TaxID=152316 RepID=A0A9P8UJG6_9PEZI|nr:uncharacterized protein BKA67DRAFT_679391 [Truncatella angustata]KAH6653588.1 hypothetical protein BKA67DRAFT_679391 [Truncatella angustata]
MMKPIANTPRTLTTARTLSQYPNESHRKPGLSRLARPQHEPGVQVIMLRRMMYMPFSDSILDYLVQKTYNAIPRNARLNTSVQPIGSATPPPLRNFISHLSREVNVPILTWIATTVYLDRLKPKLGSTREMLRCTAHRIFLASLIITAKYLDDDYRINKDWEKHSYMRFNHRLSWFTLGDIN